MRQSPESELLARPLRLGGLAICLTALLLFKSVSRSEETRADHMPVHLFYLHGKIIEDQGPDAVSLQFGPYRFGDIVRRFEDEGFIVSAPVRGKDSDVAMAAAETAAEIRALLASGIPAHRVTVVGASKGSYIATLVAHDIGEQDLGLVILAGCAPSVLQTMKQRGVRLSGQVLAVREADDPLAGPCGAAVEESPHAVLHGDLTTDLGLGHGLIYTPHDEWVLPVTAFANRAATDR